MTLAAQSTATLALKVRHIHLEQSRLAGLPLNRSVNSTDGARGPASPADPLPIRAPAKLKVLSLFAGIGGFDLGLERTGGFETVAFCEIDPFCQRVLAKHWPEVPCYDDVRELTRDRLAADGIAVDVICGGFPCQPFSSASRGRRVAKDLWPEMRRVIAEVRPRYVIAENVKRAPLRRVEEFLTGIGYSCTQPRDIPCAAAGADHQRSRWWVCAYPDDQGELLSAIHAEMAFLPQVCEGIWGAGNYARAIRVPDGLSNRVDRLTALGNAINPHIAEVFGRAILSAKPHLAQHGSDQSSLCVDPLFHAAGDAA